MSRKTAAQLVRDSKTNKSGSSWYNRLSLEEREYICKVVGEMRKNPGAALTLVASQLIDIFKIKCSIQTVASTLRGLIRDGKN